MNYSWKLEKRSVYGKTLFNEIHSFVIEGIEETTIDWTSEAHRGYFVEIIEEMLEEKGIEGKISQCKVVCDHRNNTLDDLQHKRYTIDIEYKQQQCHARTKLRYEVSHQPRTINISRK